MHQIKATFPLLAGLALGACATMLQGEAREEAIGECAEMGLRFLETDASAREGLIMSTGGVTGLCVGPDDPRYAEAVGPDSEPKR